MEHLHPSLIVQRVLEGNESLMWADRPKQGLLVHGADGIAALSGLMWVVLSVAWAWNAYKAGAAPQQLALAIPFAVYGLYLLTGRFLAEVLRRRHILYGLTDRRALILSGWRTQRVTSFDLGQIERISLTHHRDGTGTILFGTEEEVQIRLPGRGTKAEMRIVGARFESIDRPRYVHDMFREARDMALKTPAGTDAWGEVRVGV